MVNAEASVEQEKTIEESDIIEFQLINDLILFRRESGLEKLK
jgi:hypothetical protein